MPAYSADPSNPIADDQYNGEALLTIKEITTEDCTRIQLIPQQPAPALDPKRVGDAIAEPLLYHRLAKTNGCRLSG